MDRVSIYIDGANFYLLAFKRLGVHDADFDFDAFADFLAAGRKIISPPNGKRYYIGTVREVPGDYRSRTAMSRQTSLFTRLTTGGWGIKTSKHRLKTDEIVVDNRVWPKDAMLAAGISKFTLQHYVEKGIDVKLATDLIVGAVDNQYDTAIIVSSDTDLIPAFDWIRMRLKKKVEYIGFSIPNEEDPRKSVKPTYAMFKKTDVQRVLVESDLRALLLSKTKPTTKPPAGES